jgi:DNA-binding GntR family transcriptional regulator
MESEGPVEYVPRFGITVRMPERKELEDIYAVPEALESYGAAEAAFRITPEQLAKVKRVYGTMRQTEDEFARSGEERMPAEALTRFVTVEMQFDNLIMLATSNGYMVSIMERAWLMSRISTATFRVYTRSRRQKPTSFTAA